MVTNEKTSKYAQIAGHFKRLIIDGDIKPGDQLMSENEIAEKFKVSRHTVRQALFKLEQDEYIYKEQGRGTFCNNLKKDEENNKKTIAVITTYISNYIFPSIIRGIEEILSSAGYSLLLFNTNNEKSKEREYLKKVLEYNVAGLIIEPTLSALDNINEEYYSELENRNIPYIMINAKYNELNSACIAMDDVEGGYILTKYLIQLGHKNIAGIFKDDDLQGINRKMGYIKALAESDIPVNEDIIGRYVTKDEMFSTYEFTKALLGRNNRPTAIVCYNDQVAINALNAIRDEGLRVPKDMSLVSYDDSDIAIASEVKLTTIRHPKDEMGRRAARFIIDMIEKRTNKLSYTYKPELIVRDSAISI